MASGSNTFGGTVKLSGETEYKKALANISAQLGVFGSELNKVTMQFGKNDKSIESNAQRSEILNKKLSAQKEGLNVLREGLESAKKMYGETDTRTLKWQKSLVNAEADIMKTTKEIEDLGKEGEESSDKIEDFGTEIADSGNKAENSANGGYTIFKNVIANLATDTIQKAIGSLKQLGSSIINVGKQAIDSYANYEQLIGGIDTLFKDSSEIVQSYASEAYKTAGLSANDYMDTVTSFSASLLSSLKGNTEKSAEVANMAITDMSDNANKMGTSMDSIQNAYQGFAKQQYNMLDNLKLGYGGTKTEMERLLKDAQEISGVKYDIKNLSDVYNAIHVIQGELGITGTTAEEASTTIQGSISAMKSAWQNLLSDMANENADLEGSMGNLVDSVLTVADNLIPRISTLVPGMIEALIKGVMMLLPELSNIASDIITSFSKGVNDNLPDIIETGSNLLTSLINGISTQLPQLVPTVLKIITGLTQTLLQNLPTILQMGITLLVELAKGLGQSIPQLIPVVIDTVMTLINTILDNIDLIVDTGIQMLMSIQQGLLDALPGLIDKIPEIIDKLIMALTDNLPKLLMSGYEMTIKLAMGLIKAIPNLLAAIPKIVTSIVVGIANFAFKLVQQGAELVKKLGAGLLDGIVHIKDIGKNLVEGLWNGIKDTTSWILDKIKGFGESVLDGIKSIFGINSPSRVFRDEVGKNLALGLGEGFTQEMDNVNRDIQKALPTDLDVSSNVNVNENIHSSNKNPNSDNTSSNNIYNINIYSVENNPSDHARQIRNEFEYMQLRAD